MRSKSTGFHNGGDASSFTEDMSSGPARTGTVIPRILSAQAVADTDCEWIRRVRSALRNSTGNLRPGGSKSRSSPIALENAIVGQSGFRGSGATAPLIVHNARKARRRYDFLIGGKAMGVARGNSLLMQASVAVVIFVAPMTAFAESPLRVGAGEAFSSIAEAVKAARKGQLIEIGSGIYRESVEIRKALAIAGADTGGGLPVIDVAGKDFAFHLVADGITISNLTITGDEPAVSHPDSAGLAQTRAAILIESSGNQIRDLVIRDTMNGILVFGDRNRVEGNTVASASISGIALRSGRENAVIGNVLDANAVYGVYLGWLVDPAIVRKDPLQYGEIMRNLRPVENNRVENNKATGNGYAGFVLGAAANSNFLGENTATMNGGKVAGEKLTWFTGAGMVLSCGPSGNRIEHNEVRANDNTGIYINPGTENVFEQNLVVDNAGYGIAVSASVGNRFLGNEVSGHSQYGVLFKRWDEAQFPNSRNRLSLNNLLGNATNAFDDSGVPFSLPPGVKVANEEHRQDLVEKYESPNFWDDGEKGNHHDDFDSEIEGFTDSDGDGVGEAALPIPGGAAIDHHPLAPAGVSAIRKAADFPADVPGSRDCAVVCGSIGIGVSTVCN